MHIAVCDDNMADRHQMERLLKREADRRKDSSCNLYTDSFGNCESLLANPMQYDAFYIDMCKTEGITGIDVANRLIALGVNAPIVMCCSDIDYRKHSFPENVIFLEKPIKADALTESIEHALQIKDSADSLIELRTDKETFYVQESDILYATGEKRNTVVVLTDGRQINIATDISNLFSQIEAFPSFLGCSAKAIVNCRYIRKLSFGKATMSDGAVFKIHRNCMAYAKMQFEYFSNLSQ